jgi:hypothetical protein
MIEKTYEMSRIRRGRLATVPTWVLTLPDGTVEKFCTKKRATERERRFKESQRAISPQSASNEP